MNSRHLIRIATVLKHSTTRAARALARRVRLDGALTALARRLRRSRLRIEDIVPHEIHRFDKHTWVLKETPSGVRLWCSLDDRAISRPILLDEYELVELAFARAQVRPGDYAIDVGANLGYFALHLAQCAGPGGLVDAFEPLAYLFEALCASAAENRFEAELRAHALALDEETGTRALRHAPRTANFGGAHFAPAGEPPPAHADETVATVRLDDVAAPRRCALIKIDAEGAEPRILRGARRTLAESRPLILAELHNPQLAVVSRSTASDLIGLMASFDYECRSLAADATLGARLERYADPAPLNVVFVPRASKPPL